jgi:hypothetical protein
MRWVMVAWLGACQGAADKTADTDAGGSFVEVEALFARSCATSGCHGGPEYSTGLDLSAGQAHGLLVGQDSTQLPSMKLVAPGEPEASYLLHKVRGTHEEVGGSGELMPPPFGLADADLASIVAWIEDGAPL